MKALFIIAVAAVALAGCGRISRGTAYITGHSEQCIDGIQYLQFPSGAAVKIDRVTLQPEKC